jgi:hypothetical protein
MDPLGLQAAIAKAEDALKTTMNAETSALKELIDYSALKYEAAGQALIRYAVQALTGKQITINLK